MAVLGDWILVSSLRRPVEAQSHQKITHEMFDRWMTELSNWSRWGKDDQVGTVNLITPGKRKQAMALVKEGVLFSMARDPETESRGQCGAHRSSDDAGRGEKPERRFLRQRGHVL